MSSILGLIVTAVVGVKTIRNICRQGREQKMATEQAELVENARRVRETQEQKQLKEAERRAQFQREREKECQQAAIEGKDVCHHCKTIQPERCACGKCIASSYPCWDNQSPYTSDECETCYWKRKKAAYGATKRAGRDVCDVCLSVNPDRCDEGHCMICVGRATSGDGRCYCGNCLECYGWAGGNECNVCSSDD